MRILKENTLAVIIDVQEKLFPHMSEYEELEHYLNILIKGLKLLDIPLIVTEQYTRGLGFTIPSLASSLQNFSPFEKTSFSCCDDTYISEGIQEYKPVHIIVAGIEAHVCVLQTVTDLIQKGYIPVVIADCISSRKLLDKQIALERMNKEGALISTCESVLFELTRFSGTDLFRAVSKLIK